MLIRCKFHRFRYCIIERTNAWLFGKELVVSGGDDMVNGMLEKEDPEENGRSRAGRIEYFEVITVCIIQGVSLA